MLPTGFSDLIYNNINPHIITDLTKICFQEQKFLQLFFENALAAHAIELQKVIARYEDVRCLEADP